MADPNPNPMFWILDFGFWIPILDLIFGSHRIPYSAKRILLTFLKFVIMPGPSLSQSNAAPTTGIPDYEALAVSINNKY